MLRAQAREILGKKWFHKYLDWRARAGVAQRKAPRRRRPGWVAEDEATQRWATPAARSPRDLGNHFEIEAACPRRSQKLRRGHANDEIAKKIRAWAE